ncbi:hypothetical protein H257_14763 [Aphanomyces astaci]|uniref:Uncharacterized protein n=1 Tax=Aphanomyces astaci TaxID=112090 RepID=W4FPW3_APHAT|nr:hypothetical protein H257_14763 [Aphanomyces astaci]ETV69527.1 hypothetical protein H257_14763 [Aphanomyces astaci]|eukprot:XP_009840951.1 hypothetical protein H257_14763 [Aphanomyces astaci]
MAREPARPPAHREATGRPVIKNKLCIINAARDMSPHAALDTYFSGPERRARRLAVLVEDIVLVDWTHVECYQV